MMPVMLPRDMTSDSVMLPHTRVDDLNLHLGMLDLLQSVLECLQTALDVGLDDEVEVLDPRPRRCGRTPRPR